MQKPPSKENFGICPRCNTVTKGTHYMSDDKYHIYRCENPETHENGKKFYHTFSILHEDGKKLIKKERKKTKHKNTNDSINKKIDTLSYSIIIVGGIEIGKEYFKKGKKKETIEEVVSKLNPNDLPLEDAVETTDKADDMQSFFGIARTFIKELLD